MGNVGHPKGQAAHYPGTQMHCVVCVSGASSWPVPSNLHKCVCSSNGVQCLHTLMYRAVSQSKDNYKKSCPRCTSSQTCLSDALLLHSHSAQWTKGPRAGCAHGCHMLQMGRYTEQPAARKAHGNCSRRLTRGVVTQPSTQVDVVLYTQAVAQPAVLAQQQITVLTHSRHTGSAQNQACKNPLPKTHHSCMLSLPLQNVTIFLCA